MGLLAESSPRDDEDPAVAELVEHTPQVASAARLREVAEEGVQAVADRPSAVRRRAEELLDFARFMEREMPALVRRYHDERTGRP